MSNTNNTPLCIHCTYIRMADARHPKCAHPSAERDRVDGHLVRCCAAERDPIGRPVRFCGPEGLGYWPSAHVGKPGMDGISEAINGL